MGVTPSLSKEACCRKIYGHTEKRRRNEQNPKDPQFVHVGNYYYGYQTKDDGMGGIKQHACGR
jgi:hypothetical protein